MVAVLLTATACTAGQSAGGPGRPSSSDSSASSGANAASSSPESSPFKGAWIDATADALGVTGDWTNKVELADIDGDGDVDILFANGGDYDTAGKPVASRVFMNNGAGKFQDATQRVFGKTKALARVIKVADVNGDSAPDVVLGTTYDSQSRLFLGSSAGGWTDVTQKNFPAADLSAGDLEFGDVDGDEDLDIVIADWGDGSPLGQGGKVVLWLNNGAGKFTEAAPAQMPKTLVQFSRDLELLAAHSGRPLPACRAHGHYSSPAEGGTRTTARPRFRCGPHGPVCLRGLAEATIGLATLRLPIFI